MQIGRSKPLRTLVAMASLSSFLMAVLRSAQTVSSPRMASWTLFERVSLVRAACSSSFSLAAALGACLRPESLLSLLPVLLLLRGPADSLLLRSS